MLVSMANQIRHDIKDGLYIFQQHNSTRWYARFTVTGKWISRATSKQEKEEAIVKAIELQTEYKYAERNNWPIQSKRFKDVAKLAIKEMEYLLSINDGKKVFYDYIGALNKYYIEYFDNTYVTAIDSEMINSFNQWN